MSDFRKPKTSWGKRRRWELRKMGNVYLVVGVGPKQHWCRPATDYEAALWRALQRELNKRQHFGWTFTKTKRKKK